MLKVIAWICIVGLAVASWTPGQDMIRTGFNTRLEHTVAYLIAGIATARARELTMRECVQKYKAARSAGTLKGTQEEWEDFRKAECATDAKPAAAPAPAAPKAAK